MRLGLFVSWLLVIVSAPPASSNDWPHWRGPEQNGISRETGLVDDWSWDDRTNVLWASDIGGRATPVILDGRIYLNCRTHHDVNDPQEKIHAREQVVCRDANTGEVIWRDEFNVFQTDIPAPRVGWASMAADPETGNVYVHSVSGLFRCYDRDGNLKWQYSLFEDFGKISGYGGRTQTPIIDEDRVIVSFLCSNWGDRAGPPKDTYYAFDKRTGTVLWTSAPGGRPHDTIYSCPVVTVIEGTRMLIGGGADGSVYAMNARTGEPLWGFRLSKRGLNATPVVDGKYVYISHSEDDVDSLSFGRIQCIDATGRGDVTETHGVWRVNGVTAGYTALLVKDGILYVVANTGKLHAFDSQTGQALWVHNLGTEGKGSPVWADGKLYVTEVKGNVYILRPSRQGCETLSHVQLTSAWGEGYDEIYASPAVANGKIYLVTRDRTICLGNPDLPYSSNPVPPVPEETPPVNEIATIQLVPFEDHVMGQGELEYELRAYDPHGRFLKTLSPKLELEQGLTEVSVEDSRFVVPQGTTEQAGYVAARYENLVARARVRIFPSLPWLWDFEGYQGRQVPPTWIAAAGKLLPETLEGNTVMRSHIDRGRPSAHIWLGPPEMKDYTIQADVRMTEERRRLPSVGITAQRYNLILKGNVAKLSVQSWQAHLRMAKEITFPCEANIWYTMKLRVDIEADGAHVRGKVWPRSDPEPGEWTIEAIDPHPNENGSPGLYLYALADTYFDNVIVKTE